MLKSPEKFPGVKGESQSEKSLEKEKEREKEEKALAIVKEIKALKKKAKTKEDWELLIQKRNEIEKIFTPENEIEKIFTPENEIEKIFTTKEGWQLEGKLGEENVLAEYPAEGKVSSVNFSPDGKKLALGSSYGDYGMARVIGKR